MLNSQFALFRQLLDDFSSLLGVVAREHSVAPDEPGELVIAGVGFGLFQPRDRWGDDHTAFILRRLETDLSEESLAWHEDCADAVATFSLLAFGALLGKLTAGDLSDTELLLAEGHLAGFIMQHGVRICEVYHAFLGEPPPSSPRSGE